MQSGLLKLSSVLLSIPGPLWKGDTLKICLYCFWLFGAVASSARHLSAVLQSTNVLSAVCCFGSTKEQQSISYRFRKASPQVIIYTWSDQDFHFRTMPTITETEVAQFIPLCQPKPWQAGAWHNMRKQCAKMLNIVLVIVWKLLLFNCCVLQLINLLEIRWPCCSTIFSLLWP